MPVIPENFHDLLEQKKAFAHLATIMPDGSPQVTPVWFDYTGGMIRVNTAKGRVKARNLREGGPVSLSASIRAGPSVTACARRATPRWPTTSAHGPEPRRGAARPCRCSMLAA